MPSVSMSAVLSGGETHLLAVVPGGTGLLACVLSLLWSRDLAHSRNLRNTFKMCV